MSGTTAILGSNIVLSNNVMIAGHVAVGDNVIMGGGAAVISSRRVGAHAFVGGLAGLENDLIPFGMVMGNRARLSGLNLVGLKRRNFPREQIHALRAAYKELFESDEGTLHDRARIVKAANPDAPPSSSRSRTSSWRRATGGCARRAPATTRAYSHRIVMIRF